MAATGLSDAPGFPAAAPARPWHALPASEVVAALDADATAGLSEAEARERLARFGANRLTAEKHESLVDIFLEEVREPMILLLLGTGVLYALWGGLGDALTILAVILAIVGVEVYNERRAKAALAALRQLTAPTVLVIRDGQPREAPTDTLVPGDVLPLRDGQRMPADARLLESYGLWADESPLTGESAPVEKESGAILPAEAPLAERRNLVFAGTPLTRGRGTAVVVATGMATELGHVAGLAAGIREPRTPLQMTMRELTRWMVWLALGFSTLVPLLGWLLAGQSPRQMVLTGLSLAFATIPEELPILITVVLALGAYRLSRQHAIVKRLRAAETLSAVTVIAADKTGTLTRNTLEVSHLYPEDLRTRLLEIGALCNDALAHGSDFTGDPLDVALARAARDAGVDAAALRREAPLRVEFTFDTERKLMSAAYARDGELWVAVKGAPEAVLARAAHRATAGGAEPLTEAACETLLKEAERMTAAGQRVIALAERTAPDGRLTEEEAESALTVVGLAGLADPPRPEVRAAIAACRTAGIRPVMITGDHPLTARAIAEQVGLNGAGRMLTGPELDALSDELLRAAAGETGIYARITPEHKLRIVRALHERGERVAVTGDGINDAPALAAADIGIAMGETGTDVAREAADIVLADDNFATIAHAVQEGRLLFANLRKAVRYYLACKVALVSATLLPVLLFVPVPFAPLQIILMELLMDVAASATFVSEPAEDDLMRRKPRDPRLPFMNGAMAASIFGAAAGLFGAVSLVYLLTWFSGAGLVRAQTVAFVTWLLGHVFLALNLRSERQPLLRLGPLRNRLMLAWAGATLVVVLVVTLVPAAQAQLHTTSLTGGEWLLALSAAFVGTFWIEARKWLRRAADTRWNVPTT